jgi:hypothetical protein
MTPEQVSLVQESFKNADHYGPGSRSLLRPAVRDRAAGATLFPADLKE